MILNIDKKQFIYFFLLVASSGLIFGRTSICVYFLTADQFGTLSKSLIMSNTLITYAGLGMQHLILKKLPMYYTNHEKAKIDILLNQALVIFTAATILISTIIMIASVIGLNRGPLLPLMIVFHSFFQFVFLIFQLNVRSQFEFLRYSGIALGRAVLIFMLVLILVTYQPSLYYVLACEMFVNLLLVIYLVYNDSIKMTLSVRVLIDGFSQLKDNMLNALKLLFLNGAAYSMMTFDKWLGVLVLSSATYAHYAVGILFLMTLETLQMILNISIFPILSRIVGKGDYAHAYRLTVKLSFTLLFLGLLAYYPLTSLLQIILRLFLPEYLQSVSLIKILILAGVIRLSDFFSTFCILIDKELKFAS